jgi:6-phosphogluconolactonase
MNPTILYTPNVAHTASELFVKHMQKALERKNSFAVVLSGGSTPLKMYDLLKAQSLPWDKVHFFWGDERFVAHDHPDSNYGAAKRAWLDLIDVSEENIHPMPYLENIQNAAHTYANEIITTLGETPIFDFAFLGLGDDAHTASLFPGTRAVFDEGLVTVCQPATANHQRITLTPLALSQSRIVAFLVSGESKRKALEATLNGTNDFDQFPARSINALEELFWITDVKL